MSAIAEQESGREPASDIGPIDHTKTMPSTNFAELLARVSRETGKGYFQQIREMYRLKFGPGQIAPVEYFYYRLYDDALSNGEKAAFVGVNLRAKVNNSFLDRTLFGIGTDKLTFYLCMKGLGIPVPETRAILHPTRLINGAQPLRTREEFSAWLRDPANYPFFSKPNSMTASVGIAAVEKYHADSDTIELASGLRYPVERFVREAAQYLENGYLIQERLRAGTEIASTTGQRLSTVRMMVLMEDGVPHLIRSTWRIPVGENDADVYWRGNLMAAMDEHGKVLRVVKGRGLDLAEVDCHPDTGVQLVGLQFPRWDALRELVMQAAIGLPGLRITGWDVSLTNRGPVLIELEPDGGDPAVTQLASGKGLLDGPYGRFLTHCRTRDRKPAVS